MYGCKARQLDTLERYWETKYTGFQHPFLKDVVDMLLQDQLSPTSVAEICRQHRISRQTLHHHFDRYLCKTPSEFKQVVRFRQAMKNYQSLTANQGLSQIAALANYFDQSHMIRDFKRLTGYSPKAFFHRISRLGNGEVNFMFLE